MILKEEMIEKLHMILGQPVRYAYTAQPVILYIQNSDGFVPVHYYSVDFEIACDVFDIKLARSQDYVYNSHLLNFVEPGHSLDMKEPYISHSVFLDENYYNKLKSVTNTDGGLHRYDGVVEGYSIRAIKSIFDIDIVVDTGLCMTDSMIEMGGLRKPNLAFDEKRHTRFIQASESHYIKLQKKKTSVVTRVHEPKMEFLSYDLK